MSPLPKEQWGNHALNILGQLSLGLYLKLTYFDMVRRFALATVMEYGLLETLKNIFFIQKLNNYTNFKVLLQ